MVYILTPMACYVYVLPCVVEDFLKLGFSRNPAARFDAFHPRYFDVFDLDRGWLVETDSVREARTLELALRRPLATHRAPAPLTVRWHAGGHTEWLRGAFVPLWQATDALVHRGFRLHAPVRHWLHRALLDHCDTLYAWAELALPDIDASYAGQPVTPSLRRLVDALDACHAVGIDTRPWLSERMQAWYAARSHTVLFDPPTQRTS